MPLPRVFVTRRIPEVGLERIRVTCDAEIWSQPLPPSYDVIRDKIKDCDGLVSLLTDRIDATLLDAAPRLRVVSNFAVGFNNIDVPAASARGVCVGNTPGALTDATADCAFMLLIAAARRLVDGVMDVRAGRWQTWEPVGYLGQDLVGKTLGVIGMGRIGTALAKRCHRGWDMKVLYYDQYVNQAAEAECGAKRVELNELLRTSDFVSVHASLTPENHKLMGAAQFQIMKPTAVFVNTARGPLVDQAALYQALKSKTIFAAGLDVTDPEPPAMEDPLLDLPNVVIVPHIASATYSSRDSMAEICADNLIAGLTGQPLPAWVNPDVAEKRRRG
jgi:glyoxylate reductase